MSKLEDSFIVINVKRILEKLEQNGGVLDQEVI